MTLTELIARRTISRHVRGAASSLRPRADIPATTISADFCIEAARRETRRRLGQQCNGALRGQHAALQAVRHFRRKCEVRGILMEQIGTERAPLFSGRWVIFLLRRALVAVLPKRAASQPGPLPVSAARLDSTADSRAPNTRRAKCWNDGIRDAHSRGIAPHRRRHAPEAFRATGRLTLAPCDVATDRSPAAARRSAHRVRRAAVAASSPG